MSVSLKGDVFELPHIPKGYNSLMWLLGGL